MKQQHTRMPVILQVAITVLFIIFAYLVYTTTLDGVIVNKIIDFNNKDSLITDKTIYHHGDLIQVQLDYCKHRAIVGTALWKLVDGFSIQFTPRSASSLPGCYKTFVAVGDIPAFIPNGTYRIEGITSYRLNGLNTINYSLQSKDFKIQ